MSCLNSEKHKWLSNEKKKEIKFESINMTGACRSLFKLCRQAPFKAK